MLSRILLAFFVACVCFTKHTEAQAIQLLNGNCGNIANNLGIPNNIAGNQIALGNGNVANLAFGTPIINSVGAVENIACGGSGQGDIVLTGELPVTGNTGVQGTLPVFGYVTFEARVPVDGSVKILNCPNCVPQACQCQ